MEAELSVAGPLLAWYDTHRREMPWRGVGDPYAVWVSETMLQQTRVDTVRDYYPRFMAAFPTVTALAAAEEQAVFKLWEGLGYYRRAANLHRGARQVAERWGGRVPDTVEELLTVSGIGEYTAGAIASIAYGRRVPAVDGNVIRVVTRLTGDDTPLKETAALRRVKERAAALVPEDRPGDFNQAMMDLGATVCVPGTPDCAACPLQTLCRAAREGNAEGIPNLPGKKPPRPIDYEVLLILSGGRVLMRCRTEALLRGLWVYPLVEGRLEPLRLAELTAKRLGTGVPLPEPLGEARHVFTHQVWRMRLWLLRVPEGLAAPAGWRFVTAEDMRALPIPTAMRAAKAEAERAMGEAASFLRGS